MESILLADDNGAVGEKGHRLGIRGAWLLGETLEQVPFNGAGSVPPVDP